MQVKEYQGAIRMKIRILIGLFLVLALALSVGGVAAQGPKEGQGPEESKAAPLGPHPLQDHLGQSAIGGGVAWGSRWYVTDAAGFRYGLYGQSSSTSGRGVLGYATSNAGTTYGAWGLALSPNGRGVFGENRANAGSATGVYGWSASNSGGRGVYGYVNGEDGFVYGVWGQSRSTNGRGVLGYATSNAGTTNGVWGLALSPNGRGVFGENRANNGVAYGVYGRSNSSSGTGVYASGIRYGSQSFASSTSGDAVYARATATSGPAYAINARTESPDGWAGVFTSAGNGVYISTPNNKTGLTVVGGSKNAAVPTTQGERLLYAEEATEVWFADYGFGRLEGGKAIISIDPIFAETVNLNQGYHVFLQAYGDAEIFVASRTPTEFVVLGWDGDPNVEFSYRLVAKRIGHENRRLELAPWSGDAAHLYSEKEAQDRELQLATEAERSTSLEEVDHLNALNMEAQEAVEMHNAELNELEKLSGSDVLDVERQEELRQLESEINK
jgi:hypothetical protein